MPDPAPPEHAADSPPPPEVPTVDSGLAAHLAQQTLAGRKASDAATVFVVGIITGYYADAIGASLAAGYFGLLCLAIGGKALARRTLVAPDRVAPTRVSNQLRVDIWLSGLLVGCFPLLLRSLPVTTWWLAVVSTAGFGAAAATRLTGDRAAYRGYAAALYVPILASLALSPLDRHTVAMAMATAVHWAFMAGVNRKGHQILCDQFRLTQRHRIAETAAREGERFLAATIRALPIPLVIFRSGKLVEANPAFAALVPVPTSDLTSGGLSLDDLTRLMRFTPTERTALATWAESVSCEGDHPPIEVDVRREDGMRRLFRFSGLGLSDPDSPQVLACLDLTYEAEVRDRLVEAREAAYAANAAKSAFIANVGHHLRTPLNSVIGFADVMQISGEPLTDTQRRQVENIKKSGEQLLRLLTDVLELSALDAGEVHIRPTEFDICLTIREILNSRTSDASERGVELRQLGTDDCGGVLALGDVQWVARILQALLDNALSVTPGGGFVEVATRVREREVMVFLTDSGPGVAPEDREVIFQRFERGQSRGPLNRTGLGLPLARALAERQGGSLDLDPVQPDQGATFLLTLPRF